MTDKMWYPTGSEGAAKVPPLPACLWRENSYRLVSLLKMLRFVPAYYLRNKEHFLNVAYILKGQIPQEPGFSPLEVLKSTLAYQIDPLITDLDRIGLASPLRKAKEIKRLIEVLVGDYPEINKPPIATIRIALRELWERIEEECDLRFVILIPTGMQDYYENPLSKWGDTPKVFRDAMCDIQESGKCYALGRYTATVFHLMRVAEYGLRALAQKLRVKLTHSGKAHPVEYADWDKVITGAKNRIIEARKRGPGKAREEKLALYSDASDHCLFMKDIWRNAVSHARKPYTEAEAEAATGRVREFMEFLTKI